MYRLTALSWSLFYVPVEHSCFPNVLFSTLHTSFTLRFVYYKAKLLFSQSCTKFDFKVSSKKTKSLTISKEPLRCKLQIYNTTIEQVTSFNYLGVQITSSKDLNTEVRHQAIKASRISGCLNETIWSNKYLRNEAKVRIYKSVVRPILTYAAETRPNTANLCKYWK